MDTINNEKIWRKYRRREHRLLQQRCPDMRFAGNIRIVMLAYRKVKKTSNQII